MVRKEDELYICEECRFKYKEEDIAQKCEAYCKEHSSCSLEITKHAVTE